MPKAIFSLLKGDYKPEADARRPDPGTAGFGSSRRHPLQSAARLHMGGCQNYGPFLGTPNTRCCFIIGAQKSTIILTTTHI